MDASDTSEDESSGSKRYIYIKILKSIKFIFSKYIVTGLISTFLNYLIIYIKKKN